MIGPHHEHRLAEEVAARRQSLADALDAEFRQRHVGLEPELIVRIRALTEAT